MDSATTDPSRTDTPTGQLALSTSTQPPCHADHPKSLCEMPAEVLHHIALILPCREFSRLLQTSHFIHNTINSHWIWHQRFVFRFGQFALENNLSLPPRLPRPRESAEDDDDQPLVSPPPATEHDNHEDPTFTTTPFSNPSSPTLTSSSPSPSPSSPSHLTSQPVSDNDAEDDAEPSNGQAKAKESRKVDLRKTTMITKEQLIDLYRQYSRTTLPAEDLEICHMGDRYWKMIESRNSRFGKLAELRSVWWMDIAGLFFGVGPGRYKVQWRMKVTSDAPIVNSEFRVVIFDQHEDLNTLTDRPNSVLFRPKTVQEFTEQTDSKVTKANKTPFRNLFKGFTTLELPEELVIEEGFQGVFVQIRNHDGWKSGMYLDYVRLVDAEQAAQDRKAGRTSNNSSDENSNALDEEVNDEGEEYYPTSSSWLQGALGINPTLRSRAARQFQPVTEDFSLRSNNNNSNNAGPSTTLGGPSLQTSNQASSTNQRSQSSQEQKTDAWYKFFAFLFLYCIYILWWQ